MLILVGKHFLCSVEKKQQPKAADFNLLVCCYTDQLQQPQRIKNERAAHTKYLWAYIFSFVSFFIILIFTPLNILFTTFTCRQVQDRQFLSSISYVKEVHLKAHICALLSRVGETTALHTLRSHS